MREPARESARQFIEQGRTASVEETREFVAELKKQLDYGVARKVLEKALEEHPEDVWVRQQLALCTYKDDELLPTVRFGNALKVLEPLGLCVPGKADPETLGLGGAIYKRKWEYYGQIEYLYQALAFYRSAYERHPEIDKGYGGVNAAYILDLLASRARTIGKRTGTHSLEGEELQREASRLRERMAADVPSLAETDPKLKDDYWFIATVAEIHYGRGDYAEARKWLAHAVSLNPEEWKLQTTFRQLVSLARLQGCELPPEQSDRGTWVPAWQALSELLGDGTECALSCYRGKIGLALSGGGFRASFFHLGVLARMAELDILRSVEVLSTVSGGSIVGAHYYLELRNLLQTRQDGEITRQDYVGIVERMQRDFLAGVQRNLRVRTVADLLKNFKMILFPSYNPSRRIGELYEQELYARVNDGHPKNQPRRMRDLFITPKGWAASPPFRPAFHNWRRRAKVPILVLNATSLNTGHVWHFTASWMGEPPGLVGDEVDKNERCRRLYYEQAPNKDLQDYPLGYAVAASACVPGLFDPLVIDGLYPDRTIRLVDGGVYDNQGVAGLLDEQCTTILCSDASGQMADSRKPSGGLLGVVARSASIQGDRIRESEYQDLVGRLESKALNGLFYIHLKKDLEVPQVDWINCNDPSPMPDTGSKPTLYGIDTALQQRLAAIRTDLDSFTEVEANGLMLSGYLMAKREFERLQEQHASEETGGKWGGFDEGVSRLAEWPFLKLEPVMSQSETSTDLKRKEIAKQLDASKRRAFKVWRLDPRLRNLRWVLLGGGAWLLVILVRVFWNLKVVDLTLGQLIALVGALVAGLALPMWNWLDPQRTSRDILRKVVLATLGYVAAQLHLKEFDKRYIGYGSMERLLTLGEESAAKMESPSGYAPEPPRKPIPSTPGSEG